MSLPKVRGAAVFSLGTFVSSLSSRERNDHARAIDHTIAITLANNVTHDGSPLVRQVKSVLQYAYIHIEYVYDFDKISDCTAR